MQTSESLADRRMIAVPRAHLFRELIVAAGNLYCRTFHRSISRPVGGRYRCWKCLRDFASEW